MKNKANGFLGRLLLMALGYGLLAYAASRTLDFVQRTMPPDKQWWGYLFLLATGGGAVIWQQTYLNDAKGPKRRGLAFGLAVIDLLAELAMVYADTMTTAGANGMIQQVNPDFMRTWILASILAIGINILGWFFYKLWDPDKEQERRAQDIGDDIEEEAMKMLASPEVRKEMINLHSPEIKAAVMAKVAETIADRFTKQLATGGAAPAYPSMEQQPAPAGMQRPGLPNPQGYQIQAFPCPTCQIQTLPHPQAPDHCGRCGNPYAVAAPVVNYARAAAAAQPQPPLDAAWYAKYGDTLTPAQKRAYATMNSAPPEIITNQQTVPQQPPPSYHPVPLATDSKPRQEGPAAGESPFPG